jgi:hypothetical protein
VDRRTRAIGVNFRELRTGEVRRIPLLETVRKPSNAGQTPHHRARHGDIDERVARVTQPLGAVRGKAIFMIDP